MKKIAFFGGTFDPPHFGHENVAISLKEQAGIDQVLVCPTSISPLKERETPRATAEQRLEMVRISFGSIPGFEVIEEEISHPDVSYTIDTLVSLKKNYEGCEFFLFLGTDHISQLPLWKEFEKIFSIANPLFGGRAGSSPDIPSEIPDDIKKRIESGVYTIPQIEISSTDIRNRIAEELYCGHLTQAKVLDYIYQHSIYLSN